MKKILNEEISYRVQKLKNGKQMIYILGTNAESNDLINTNQDILKKHGATYNTGMKKWCWWLSGDEEDLKRQMAAYVYPCIKALTAQETIQTGGDLDTNIENTIDKLIDDINKVLNASLTKDDLNGDDEKIDIKAIKARISEFKDKLINITSAEEFKKVFGPIIKFNQALGPGFSLVNTILIMVQDPQARLVKSRGKWKYSNRRVVRGATPIALYMPHGEKKYKTPASIMMAKSKFLSDRKVKRVEDLTPGDREALDRELNKITKVEFWTLEPNWFDQRFTEVIDGKEDLAPVPDKKTYDDIKWFDQDSQATEETEKLYNAIVKTIEKSTIKLGYVDDLGGARGVSKRGEIDLLNNDVKNIGAVSTAIHEFAHELLHQTYLKDQSEEYAQFFVGMNNGRKQCEQQAELVAWIVCNYYGYEMPTAINYMGCWGIDAKKAPLVFDTVANVASYIIRQMNTNMIKTVKESIEDNSINEITGLDVANLVGLGGLYKRNKKYVNIGNENMKLTENILRNMVRECLMEAYETVQWQHFDNDDRRYESYVLVNNSDGSIIYNYTVQPGDWWKDIFDEACADADEQLQNNKYGSYSVYGCMGDEYDDDTLLYTAE
jgi:hypothetical protein